MTDRTATTWPRRPQRFLTRAFILLAFLLNTAWSQAQESMVGNFGSLVGQCAAIEDLNLMANPGARAHFARVLEAWKRSDQSTLADYGKGYRQARSNLEGVLKTQGTRAAESVAASMYAPYLVSLSQYVPDPNNAARSMVQGAANRRQAEWDAYYAKSFSPAQLGKDLGWYVNLSQGTRYTLQTIEARYRDKKLIQGLPIRFITDQARGDVNLWLGPFSTARAAEDFRQAYKERLKGFGLESLTAQFYLIPREDNSYGVAFSNGVPPAEIVPVSVAPVPEASPVLLEPHVWIVRFGTGKESPAELDAMVFKLTDRFKTALGRPGLVTLPEGTFVMTDQGRGEEAAKSAMAAYGRVFPEIPMAVHHAPQSQLKYMVAAGGRGTSPTRSSR